MRSNDFIQKRCANGSSYNKTLKEKVVENEIWDNMSFGVDVISLRINATHTLKDERVDRDLVWVFSVYHSFR